MKNKLFGDLPSSDGSANKHSLFFILNALSLYIIVFGFRGFLFSANDLVDVMSYSRFLNDNDLYPHDFYIRNIIRAFPNERTVFAGLLAFFGDSIRWVSLFLHLISSIALFSGIYKVGSLFVKSDWLRWFSVLLLFGPLYGISLGACELYYNMFIASLLAKSIGIWALYYLLKEKWNTAFIILIPGTLIHPTAGAQLFLIFAGVQMVRLLLERKKVAWQGMLIYLLTAGAYLTLLQLKMHGADGINKALFFEIFEFRLAHHFFPQYFPLSHWVIELGIILFSVYYFIVHRNKTVLYFILITTAGLLLYSLNIFVVKSELILSSQWFKSSIWLEMLAVIATLGFIESYWKKYLPKLKEGILFPVLLWISALIILVMLQFPGNYFSEKRHDLFYQYRLSNEAMIGLEAQKRTPVDALFIVPMHFTEFKYYSERSLYIDYKSVVHRKDALGIWYDRIGEVYGIDYANRKKRDELYKIGEYNYRALSKFKIRQLQSKGVNYIIAFSGQALPFKKLAENESYVLYQID